MFVAPDDESAVAAWNPVDAVTVDLDGTETELEVLEGSESDLRQSPDGRFVVTTFVGGDDEAVVLADLETGQVTSIGRRHRRWRVQPRRPVPARAPISRRGTRGGRHRRDRRAERNWC